ncbi:fumarylacetoacetate hydrolase family protein [Jannaschia pohangensis]|uniref:Fumarylpyruvate hydrolase n=1 Tax=Jannaschia pohangensis TaxID=390807 RepID=A0A1I3TTN1_9RHOB|nr:fumarylacetoacetate hydrolase family protein [Jannaschia pohangensis]SFJ74135.1 fumarylpyruvate hydrolase [Jannaschia pohangensis]
MAMLLFQVPDAPILQIADEDSYFPVNRVFCVGRNYAAHAAEMGNEVDREAPFYFTKSPASVTRSGATLPYPPETSDYHHEVEFVLAIGSPVFRAGRETANGAILAYGVGLDMTRRDLQGLAKDKRRPWDLGKDVEGSAILAPMTRAETFGPVGSQRIALTVNGNLRQEGHLSDMIHDCAAIVADLSRFYHLVPGDIIMTGTPSGVGPVVAGDVIEGTVDGLTPVTLTLTEAE